MAEDDPPPDPSRRGLEDPPPNPNTDTNVNLNNSPELPNSPTKEKPVYKYAMNSLGPFKIFLESNDHNLGRLHPLAVGRMLFNNNVPNIVKVETLGRNRICVQFNSQSAANSFLDNPVLKTENLRAYVPTHCVTRVGVVKDIDVNIDEKTILENMKNNKNINILKIHRMSRRTTSTDGTPSYTPSTTIQVTFEGRNLPDYITLFYCSRSVEIYTFPVTQCYNCCRFGHITKNCKSSPRCAKCSEDHQSINCTKDDTHPKISINCNGDHSATYKSCPEYKRQVAIKKIMALDGLTYFEASGQVPKILSNVTLPNPINVTSSPQQFPLLSYNSSPITTTIRQPIRRTYSKATTSPSTAPVSKKRKDSSPFSNPIAAQIDNLLISPNGRSNLPTLYSFPSTSSTLLSPNDPFFSTLISVLNSLNLDPTIKANIVQATINKISNGSSVPRAQTASMEHPKHQSK